MGLWDWLFASKEWYWFDTWSRWGSSWEKREDLGPEKLTDEESVEVQHSQTLEWLSETEDFVVTGRWIWDRTTQEWVLL